MDEEIVDNANPQIPQIAEAIQNAEAVEAIQDVEADVIAMHAAKRRLMAEMEAKSEIQGLKSYVKDKFNSMIDKENWFLEAHNAYRAANVTDRTFLREVKTLVDEDKVFDGIRIEITPNETIQSFLIKIKDIYNINESQRIMDIYSGVGLRNMDPSKRCKKSSLR